MGRGAVVGIEENVVLGMEVGQWVDVRIRPWSWTRGRLTWIGLAGVAVQFTVEGQSMYRLWDDIRRIDPDGPGKTQS